jgi:hypothetical protein
MDHGVKGQRGGIGNLQQTAHGAPLWQRVITIPQSPESRNVLRRSSESPDPERELALFALNHYNMPSGPIGLVEGGHPPSARAAIRRRPDPSKQPFPVEEAERTARASVRLIPHHFSVFFLSMRNPGPLAAFRVLDRSRMQTVSFFPIIKRAQDQPLGGGHGHTGVDAGTRPANRKRGCGAVACNTGGCVSTIRGPIIIFEQVRDSVECVALPTSPADAVFLTAFPTRPRPFHVPAGADRSEGSSGRVENREDP